jgi:hypothetical protein
MFGFRTSANHFAGGEDQSRSPGFSDSHDYGGKTLRVVFRISGMKRNFLQIQLNT